MVNQGTYEDDPELHQPMPTQNPNNPMARDHQQREPMGKDATNSSSRGRLTKEMEMARPYATQTIQQHSPSNSELEPLRSKKERAPTEHLAEGAGKGLDTDGHTWKQLEGITQDCGERRNAVIGGHKAKFGGCSIEKTRYITMLATLYMVIDRTFLYLQMQSIHGGKHLFSSFFIADVAGQDLQINLNRHRHSLF